MTLNFLIIDDEPIAHKLIENFSKDLSYLNLVGNCYNAMDALPLLKQQIDLIFLDVNMPRISGFELIKSLPNPPQIVIISAHKEFALESYEYAITDYLLKPFNFERFFKSVQKVMDKRTVAEVPLPPTSSAASIFIKDEKKHHKVALDDILHIAANGNYSSVFHKNGRILSQMKISDFEKLLPKDQFYRIHRSYMISKNAITLISASEVHLGDIVIPVGRVYKDTIEALLKSS